MITDQVPYQEPSEPCLSLLFGDRTNGPDYYITFRNWR
ncbi:MAG: hypothetical protein BMS9Abin29_0470 [Gemmatimonadota bacterium]|nr:MAG: hypothetical protein BMS9Abin29_0470 [Gemmatimonadota bacterium]